MPDDLPRDGAAPTFYDRLEPFDDFAEVADEGRYVQAPEDWAVVLTDVRGSTEAARAGRYKDVNLIGAACITAALNATRGFGMPYAFGGDGAVLLVPEERWQAVAAALRRTRRLAMSQFALDLRIGMVPMAEIRRRGREVLVAKFELSCGNHLAMFTGGGIELADRLVKDEVEGAPFRLPEVEDSEPPDLEGLSCRWEPYRALRGRMLTLLVRPLAVDGRELQREVVARISRLLAGGGAAAPVQRANMRFVWPPAGLAAEVRLARGRTALWRRRAWLWLESFVQLIAERFDLRIGPYDAPAYREELRRNSDYRKLADTLHMVLDCAAEEVAAIERYLEEQRASGRLVYGLHRADRAMMTCLVFSLEEGRHVHFVDGADGGYALAAVQLKAQLQEHAGAGPPRADR